MSTAERWTAPGMTVMVPRNRIRRNRKQPREYFDPKELRALAAGMELITQIQAVLVRVVEGDPKHDYELIEGERRWRASAYIAKDYMLRCEIRQVKNEADQFLQSVVANFGRQGHTPLEVARALARLQADHGFNQTQLAIACCKDQMFVSQHLRLLKLDPVVQRLIEPTKKRRKPLLSFRVACMLAGIPVEEQLRIARYVVDKGMKLKEARHYTTTQIRALERDEVVDGRKFRPVDHYRRIQSFIKRFGVDADIILDMKQHEFDEIFARRHPGDRDLMIKSVNNSISQLTQLKQSLERVKPAIGLVRTSVPGKPSVARVAAMR